MLTIYSFFSFIGSRFFFRFDAFGFIPPTARGKGLVVGGRKFMLVVRTRVLKRSNNVTCALAGFFLKYRFRRC